VGNRQCESYLERVHRCVRYLHEILHATDVCETPSRSVQPLLGFSVVTEHPRVGSRADGSFDCTVEDRVRQPTGRSYYDCAFGRPCKYRFLGFHQRQYLQRAVHDFIQQRIRGGSRCPCCCTEDREKSLKFGRTAWSTVHCDAHTSWDTVDSAKWRLSSTTAAGGPEDQCSHIFILYPVSVICF